MNTYIALFRGINVGGKNQISMKELSGILETMDFHDVRTYIQSGNVVFRGEISDPKICSEQISHAILKNNGFNPV